MGKKSMMEFSRKGDRGYTSLLGGEGDPVNKYRVPKYHPRPESYGIVDEANAALYMTRAGTRSEKVKEIVCSIQEDFSLLMAELATAPEAYEKSGYKITEGHVQRLEGLIQELQEDVELPSVFIMSKPCLSAAAIDLARTIVRRAERSVARLRHDSIITNDNVNSYLNRCADLLWTLARYEEAMNDKCG